ncbi:MAG: HigA family addiction module antidote protein [Gammaproteobacteria bacterium]|nr:HigA family addiction module antidote protein [Gammaproteobacteria bacterium]
MSQDGPTTGLGTHPGRVLRAELDTRGMSANQLALALRVPANRITAILRGERAISAETAVRLGRYLGTGPALWMNLQTQFDISVVETTKGEAIDRELAGAPRP